MHTGIKTCVIDLHVRKFTLYCLRETNRDAYQLLSNSRRSGKLISPSPEQTNKPTKKTTNKPTNKRNKNEKKKTRDKKYFRLIIFWKYVAFCSVTTFAAWLFLLNHRDNCLSCCFICDLCTLLYWVLTNLLIVEEWALDIVNNMLYRAGMFCNAPSPPPPPIPVVQSPCSQGALSSQRADWNVPKSNWT